MKKRLHIIGQWIFLLLQMGIGCLVIKTGYDLAIGNLPGMNSFSTDPITPLFLLVLGCYFLFSGILRRHFPN